MPIPLPPHEAMRQMRFNDEFWLEFARLLNEMTDNELMNISDVESLDEPTADLFFTTLAARMIEIAGPEQMPVLDDTITLIKVILGEHMREYELAMELNKLANRFFEEDK